MPETLSEAKARAKERGIPQSHAMKSESGEAHIAPPGLTEKAAMEAYVECRADGGSREKCAKIAWSIEKKIKGE